jgi:hypothetical protein
MGAYQPRDRDVTAVEPEPAMAGSRPSVQAYADALPFDDDAFDAAMAVQTVPISHDCRDGFLGAYWRRPERYLDPGAQQAISAPAMLDPAIRERGLTALARDLESGAWAARHADLTDRMVADLGYRLVVARHT